MKEKVLLFMTWLWLLSGAVLATIYLAWLAYPLVIDHLKIDQVVLMTPKSIWFNFNTLMVYLTNPSVSKLHLASFSSSFEGLSHFKDVKWLFRFCQLVFLSLSVPSVRFLRRQRGQADSFTLRSFFLKAALLPILIAFMALFIGFDQFFILFHHILFAGKTNWTFDPLRDPVIWILPETFFMYCFIAFFIIYEVFMCGIIVTNGIKRPQKSF
ncbi:TIGR01906 family membrane protein [Streptococcus ictaluri]